MNGDDTSRGKKEEKIALNTKTRSLGKKTYMPA